VPENLDVAGVLPIGTPKGQMDVPPRKPPRVHEQRYVKSD
jgi:hypothetical protein